MHLRLISTGVTYYACTVNLYNVKVACKLTKDHRSALLTWVCFRSQGLMHMVWSSLASASTWIGLKYILVLGEILYDLELHPTGLFSWHRLQTKVFCTLVIHTRGKLRLDIRYCQRRRPALRKYMASHSIVTKEIAHPSLGDNYPSTATKLCWSLQ